MNLANFFLAGIAIYLAGTIVFILFSAMNGWWKYRGQRLVTCPETQLPAAVRINTAKVARDAIFGKPQLRLDRCSSWPERGRCGQNCLTEIATDPAQCLVRNMVSKWYQGKSCAYCQKPFAQIQWHDRQPALLAPDRALVQWNEVPPERLPEMFATHLPVCWNCYIAETFRKQHPERVVDRPWKRGTNGAYVTKQVDALPVPKSKPQN
ncbi:MAG TPA: hypothetical protein VGI13_06930 [Candidatus Acidoferrum sp.]